MTMTTERTMSGIIKVKGMTCQSCVKSIQDRISTLPGVGSIQVSLREEKAEVTFDDSVTSLDKLRKEIEEMGFDASLPESHGGTELRLKIEGMTCNSCVRTIEDNMSSKEGICQASVSLEAMEGMFLFDPNKITPDEIRDAVYDMGFDASILDCGDAVVCSEIAVEGMTCNSCVMSIESKVSDADGVLDVRVSLEKKEARVAHMESKISAESLKELIYDMGFDTEVKQSSPAERVSLRVEGMTCGSCVKSIEEKLSGEPGVHIIRVSLQDKRADIFFHPKESTPDKLRETIYDMGFDCFLLQSADSEAHQTVIVSIKGMTCQSCVKTITDKLSEISAISSVSVSLEENNASVDFDKSQLKLEEIVQAIDDMGFEAALSGMFFLH